VKQSSEGDGYWISIGLRWRIFENPRLPLLDESLKRADRRKENTTSKLMGKGRCLDGKGATFRLRSWCFLCVPLREPLVTSALKWRLSYLGRFILNAEDAKVLAEERRAISLIPHLLRRCRRACCGMWTKGWKLSILDRIVEFSGWRPWNKVAEYLGKPAGHMGITSKAPRQPCGASRHYDEGTWAILRRTPVNTRSIPAVLRSTWEVGQGLPAICGGAPAAGNEAPAATEGGSAVGVGGPAVGKMRMASTNSMRSNREL
jgi:hypothetical protein